MTTFLLNNTTYTAIYIDINAAINGDGTTPWTPFNTIPTLSSISDNTALIFRRINGTIPTLPYVGTQTINANNFAMIGCPMSGDSSYTSVPSASYWKNDPGEYFTAYFQQSGSSNNFLFTGKNQYLERLYISITNTNSSYQSNTATFNFSNSQNNSIVINNVVNTVDSGGYDLNLNSYNHNSIIINNCNNISFNNVIIDSPGTCLSLGSYNNLYLFNCAFRAWYPTQYGIAPQCINSFNNTSDSSTQMYGCTFYCRGSNVGTPTSPDINTRIYGINGKVECVNTIFKSENIPAAINCINFFNTTNNNFTNCNFILNNISFTTAMSYMTFNVGTHNFKSCTFSTSAESNTGILLMIDSSYGGALLNYINCTFDSLGIFGINGINDSSVGNNILNNCTYNRGTLAILNQPAYFENIYPPNNGPAIQCYNSGIMYINNLYLSSVPISNRSISLSKTSKVITNNLDVFIGDGPNYNYLNFNNSEYAAFYSSNEGGVKGNWSARSYSSQMTTSNSYRVGGANYSIRCRSHRNASNTPYLWMAPSPFTGLPITCNSTGQHTLNIYFAYKGYDPNNPPNLNDIVIQMQIPIDNNGNYTYNISNFSGNITNDSSTWVNDTGLSIKKLSVVFNMPVSGILYCRLGFFKYQISYPTGYIIIDPNFTIT